MWLLDCHSECQNKRMESDVFSLHRHTAIHIMLVGAILISSESLSCQSRCKPRSMSIASALPDCSHQDVDTEGGPCEFPQGRSGVPVQPPEAGNCCFRAAAIPVARIALEELSSGSWYTTYRTSSMTFTTIHARDELTSAAPSEAWPPGSETKPLFRCRYILRV